MKKLILPILLILGLSLTLVAADKKITSDKERITALEVSVAALQSDLAMEHEWADTVNQATEVLDKRTLDLHSRLLKVEGRGPVALNQ